MSGTNILNAASAAPKVLYSGQLSATTDTTLYTAPSTGSAIVKHAVICNTSALSVLVNAISIVPSGGTSDSTHRVVSGYTLAANDSLSLSDYLSGACLGASDTIHAQVGTANVVTITITGVENT